MYIISLLLLYRFFEIISLSIFAMTIAISNNNNNNNSVAPQHECVELKNIKYKSMMLKNNQKRGDAAAQMLHNTSATNSISHIDTYLENERAHNNSEPWGKLDKTVKISKITAYAKTYIDEHGLPTDDCLNLVAFLISCIDQKKIVKTKDVNYDRISGKIITIPFLIHGAGAGGSGSGSGSGSGLDHHATASTTKFTLRRCDKRQSTLKSLSMPVKKKLNIIADENILQE